MSLLTPKRLVASVTLALASVAGVGGAAQAGLIDIGNVTVSDVVDVSDVVEICSPDATATSGNAVVGDHNQRNDAKSRAVVEQDDCALIGNINAFDILDKGILNHSLDNIDVLVNAAVSVLSFGDTIAGGDAFDGYGL
jgi:tRNA threonylcarbamoyladenosine modification (KEOPS) complex  Pcc1 subunit